MCTDEGKVEVDIQFTRVDAMQTLAFLWRRPGKGPRLLWCLRSRSRQAGRTQRLGLTETG
jgi:hypothetical protein